MAKRPLSARPVLITPFTRRVIALIKKIPKGRVATYGQIARLAGKPHGARGVGWILNSMSEGKQLPWQRVINSKGKISFPKKSEEYLTQKRLLLKEKIRFNPDDSIDLLKFGWEKQIRPQKATARQPKMFAD